MNYWFVGAVLDDKDMTQEFIDGGVWKLGWIGAENEAAYQGELKKFKQMQVGEKIAIKATYVQKNDLPFDNPNDKKVAVMRIKAIGTIQSISNDGHTVQVDWDKSFSGKVWYFFTYLKTIWKINPEESKHSKNWRKMLVDFTFNGQQQNYKLFLESPFWRKRFLEENLEKVSEEELKAFRDFVDDTLSWIKKSVGNQERNMQNYVPKGFTKLGPVISGKQFSRILATGNNSLNNYPYINFGHNNLFFDWKGIIDFGGTKAAFSGFSYKVTVNQSNFPEFHELDGSISSSTHLFLNSYPLSSDELSFKNPDDYENALRDIFYLSEQVVKFQGDSPILNEKLQKYVDKLKTSRNIILHGAPGTGKTFLAKQIAEALGASEENHQLSFVQFHPSYDYTDFVEGLRPVMKKEQVGFKIKNGVFKEFCKLAIENSASKNITDFTKENYKKFLQNIGLNEHTIDSYYLKIEQLLGEKEFSPRKALENFETYKTLEEILKNQDSIGDFDRDNDQHNTFASAIMQLKSFRESLGEVTGREQNFVFIIDEINRGEISKIFGELFFSIDPEYRGERGKVKTQYQNLHSDEPDFYVPENVYIIGTMNDIDRSVESFDFAMRRRFRFIEIEANENADWIGEEKKAQLIRLNQAIDEIGLGSAYHVGAAYLSHESGIWEGYLEPLFRAYFEGQFSTSEVEEYLEKLKAAFDHEIEG
ncbi:MAG: AAA family ATPase [Streptococcaceae bacterium]|jgi:DNA polymerase III delta prime subunit|nr:AAA family ATPase [Streptococcaceae bacterium]